MTRSVSHSNAYREIDIRAEPVPSFDIKEY